MGIYIVGVIVLIITSWLIHRSENKRVATGNKRDRLAYMIGIPIISAVVIIVIVLVTGLIGLEQGVIDNGDFSECKLDHQQRPIVSINRGSETTGRFFLGTGNIGSTTYYYTYIKEQRGYKLHKFKTNATHIVETNDSPKITYDNYACPTPMFDFMFGGTHEKIHTEWNKVMHVPPNTMLREFKL